MRNLRGHVKDFDLESSRMLFSKCEHSEFTFKNRLEFGSCIVIFK